VDVNPNRGLAHAMQDRLHQTGGLDAPASPRDGIAGIYAVRAIQRGADPRALAAQSRHARLAAERPRSSTVVPAVTITLGRGDTPRPAHPHRRRLAVAAVAAMLLLPLGALVAGAQEAPGAFQVRYTVQPGDTLAGVAEEFGVSPDAILAASWVPNAPELDAYSTIVIPAPGQSEDEAIAQATELRGTSPFAMGAHLVRPGDTLGTIAADHGVDAATLASFNGVSDVDSLNPGDRLLIPASYGLPGMPDAATEALNSDPDVAMAGAWRPYPGAEDPAGAAAEGAAGSPVGIEGVPEYRQRYGLGSEYASGYIATETFQPGMGIDEDVFQASIGPSENPHWGYRGNIGGDGYGAYPEAMAPVLEDNGFVADVFYATDATALTDRIDDGMPVIAWLGDPAAGLQSFQDAGSYGVAPGMRALVVYGYDENGVYVSDPTAGEKTHLDWDSFMARWDVLDGMAMGIAPAG